MGGDINITGFWFETINKVRSIKFAARFHFFALVFLTRLASEVGAGLHLAKTTPTPPCRVKLIKNTD